MRKQELALELFYGGAWHDLADEDDVRADTVVTVVRGQGAEGAAFRPASITAALDNADDRYRTSNPASELYGRAGRATPVRVRVAGVVRGTAEVASLAPDESADFRAYPARGSAWADLEAGGILRRIGQASGKMFSPFRQYHEALTTVVGYWPHEDPRGARTLFTPTPGAVSLVLRGATFDADRFAGSGPLAELENTPTARSWGRFASTTASDTDGWQLSFCVKPGNLGTTGDLFNFMSWTTRNGASYSLSFFDGNKIILLADTAGGVSLINNIQSLTGLTTDWNRWQNFLIQATTTAGTTSVNVFFNTEGSNDFISWGATFAGNSSQLKQWIMFSGGAKNAVGIGHVVGTATVVESFFTTARLEAFQGHAGETAGERFERLCVLRNVPYTLLGAAADSIPMGPQQVDTFPVHLEEIVKTEDALLYDDVDAVALVLMLRRERFNRTPALELDVTDLPRRPREVLDDLDPHNYVTAAQRDGGEFTAEQTTGPMSTEPAPDGIGEYRQTVDVNLADPDADLPQVAYWWLNKGTVDLPRYPTVVLNLAALSPDLIEAAEAVDVGQVITLAGYREYVIRLMVVGLKEQIGTTSRTLAFTCSPDQQFVTGQYDDGVARYDSGSTTLKTAVNETGTAFTFRTGNVDETWRTGSDPAGLYDVLVAGEVIRVLSMGAPALVSGSYDQAATVRRSVNDVVKTLAAGDEIHVANPGRYGL